MFSGNQCAYPTCTESLVDEFGGYVGNVCHIEAAEKGGQRYNPLQTDIERCSYDNLIILCANHHNRTNDVNRYPVSVMKEMKKKHEDVIKNIRDLSSRKESVFVDFTASDVVNLPESLNLIKKDIEEIFNNELSISDAVSEMCTYFSHFKGVPYETRRLYSSLFLMSSFSDYGICFNCKTVELRLRRCNKDLIPHYHILEEAGLLTNEMVDEDTADNYPVYYRAFTTFDRNDFQIAILHMIRNKILNESDEIWFTGMVSEMNFNLLDELSMDGYIY